MGEEQDGWDFFEGNVFAGTSKERKILRIAWEDALYAEPFCWEATPDEQKQSQLFELSNEGIEQAVAWINQKYFETKE